MDFKKGTILSPVDTKCHSKS